MPPDQNSTDAERDQPLSPAERRHALVVAAVAWGIFGSAWMSMVSGAPFVTFARDRLGVNTFVFGLLSSIPFLGVFAQLVGSYWVERIGRRKLLFIITGTGSRLTWVLVAALPWVIPGRHADARVGVFLGLILLGSTLGHTGTPAWFSWFADIVPARIRGRYLGNRAALATVTAIIVSGTVTWVLDRNSGFVVFTVIFGLASVLGLVDVELFWRVRETPMPPREEARWRLRDVVAGPLSNRPFRGYLLYALSEACMFGIAGPFFWLMGLDFLGLGNFWSNIYIMLVPMIFTAMALPMWGGVCDRFGSKPLVTLGTLMTIAFPVCWALATPARHHALLATSAVIGGLFGAAIQVGDMSMLFSLTPRVSRSSYMAVLALASSLGWLIAPTIGGALGQALKPVQLHVLGWTFGNLHILMLISIAARLIHILVVIPHLPEEKPRPTRDLVRHLAVSPFLYLRRVLRSGGG